jgi:hypothetical protein
MALGRSSSSPEEKSVQLAEVMEAAPQERRDVATFSAAPRSASVKTAASLTPAPFECQLMIADRPVSATSGAQPPTISADDTIRLKVVSRDPGYVYVLAESLTADRILIHTTNIQAGSATIPAIGTLALPAIPGAQTLTVLYSDTALSLPTLGIEGVPDYSAADVITKFTVIHP